MCPTGYGADRPLCRPSLRAPPPGHGRARRYSRSPSPAQSHPPCQHIHNSDIVKSGSRLAQGFEVRGVVSTKRFFF